MNKKIDYWENMPRSNAEELMAADAFYDEEIFPLTAADFCKRILPLKIFMTVCFLP